MLPGASYGRGKRDERGGSVDDLSILGRGLDGPLAGELDGGQPKCFGALPLPGLGRAGRSCELGAPERDRRRREQDARCKPRRRCQDAGEEA